MKRVVVVGSGGLLGACLVRSLAQTAEVTALDRRAIDLSRPLGEGVLPARIDALVYVAQSPRYRDFPDGAHDVFRVNVEQPLLLLEQARDAGASHFVYASSGAVYGSGGAWLDENAPTPPSGEALGFYAASKLAAEHLLRAYAPQLHVALLRYFFIYGSGQSEGMLIPRIAANVRDGKPISLQGRDGLSINPIHVSDAARATAAALNLASSETINVAGPEARTLRQIGEIAGRLLGREPAFTVTDDGAGSELTASIGKMSALLVAPVCSPDDGIAEMLNPGRGMQ